MTIWKYTSWNGPLTLAGTDTGAESKIVPNEAFQMFRQVRKRTEAENRQSASTGPHPLPNEISRVVNGADAVPAMHRQESWREFFGETDVPIAANSNSDEDLDLSLIHI